MRKIMILIVVAGVAAACRAEARPPERLVGGPCEGCEAVFEGRPVKLAASARIAAAGEPGDPLVIEGTVRNAAKRPVAGVIVYAYHTDAKGEYPEAKGANHRHGRLRAFARTGRDGRYRFTTIRPASYPVGDPPPQHVHMHVVEPGRCHYYIDDIVFTDDPRLTEEARRQMSPRPRRSRCRKAGEGQGGTWQVQRDIVLGARIADYARCGG